MIDSVLVGTKVCQKLKYEWCKGILQQVLHVDTLDGTIALFRMLTNKDMQLETLIPNGK